MIRARTQTLGCRALGMPTMPVEPLQSQAELFEAGQDLAEVGTLGPSCADQDDDYGETFIRPFGNRTSHSDNFLEHSRTFFEQHQKIQNILEQNEQTTRVLKFAASAFADMVANSSASKSVDALTKGSLTPYQDDEVKSQPSYDKELKSVQNSPEPFPLALPLWEFQLSSNNPDMAKAVPDDLLDLNIPPLPAMDCACIGEHDHKDFLLQGCPCDVHGREENVWGPVLQFPSIDDDGGLILKEDPWRTWPPSTLNLPAADILYGYNFGTNVSHASASRSAPTVVSEDPNFQDMLGKVSDHPGTGVLETDRNGTAGVEYLGDESSLIDQAFSGDSGSGELSFDRRRTNGADNDSHLTENDGLMSPSNLPSDGACTTDCHVLVNSICNLSKVLLAHYGSKSSNASEQGNIKNLEFAVLNLSKCLLHAHSNQADSAETEQVQENKPGLAEENAFISFSDTEEPENEQFELKSSMNLEGESNEQVFARLKTLVELQSEKHAHQFPIVDCSTEGMCLHSLEVSEKDADSNNVGKDNDKPDVETLLVNQEQKSASSYLDSREVEHRLALLKARPKSHDNVNEGSATINGEGIQVQDDYIAKRMCMISQAKQKLGLNMEITSDMVEEIVQIMKRRGIEDMDLDSLETEAVWELQAAFMQKRGDVPAERIIYKSDSAPDKLSDSEESGWEHV